MTTAGRYGPDTALDWSIMAMDEATNRVNKIARSELPHAFAAVGEAVWWITIVDDSLRHSHRMTYDWAVANTVPSPADTLLGLRSVRNRVGHEVDLVDFIHPIASRPDPGDGRIAAWAWSHVPPPEREDRTERQYQWALQCHNAYETAVVEGGQGGNIAYTFGLVAGFLHVVHQRRWDELATTHVSQ